MLNVQQKLVRDSVFITSDPILRHASRIMQVGKSEIWRVLYQQLNAVTQK